MFITLCSFSIIGAILYAIYCASYFSPALPHQIRTSPVTCLVTKAVTVITREDEMGEETHRSAEVHCDYKTSGAPEKKEADPGYGSNTYHSFDGDASQNSAIVKGTIFNCTASWKVPTAKYVYKAFKVELTPQNTGLHIRDCTIAKK